MLSLAHRPMNDKERETWQRILSVHEARRQGQMVDLFLKGVEELGLRSDRAPELAKINRILKAKTGFEGVFVEGLEDGESFYTLLAEKRFPIGSFIRDSQDLNYTPAPDIVHDLYGHLPFYLDPEYAEFSSRFAKKAVSFAREPEIFRQFERFFWFTVEFGLLQTKSGIRIFGAGIASSIGECEYALSPKPQVRPFDVRAICEQEFRIDEMQATLFLIDDLKNLYQSLEQIPYLATQTLRKGS